MQTTDVQAMQTLPTAAKTIGPEIIEALDDAFGRPNFTTCRPALDAPSPPATEMYVEWLDTVIRLAERCRAAVTGDTEFKDYEWETAEVETDLYLHLLAIRDDKAVIATCDAVRTAGSRLVGWRKAERARLVAARHETQQKVFRSRIDAYAASQIR